MKVNKNDIKDWLSVCVWVLVLSFILSVVITIALFVINIVKYHIKTSFLEYLFCLLIIWGIIFFVVILILLFFVIVDKIRGDG